MLAEALEEGLIPQAVILLENTSMPEGEPFSGLNPELVFTTDAAAFGRISTQSTPEGVVTVIPFPAWPEDALQAGPAFVLDQIQDPGNLGTLIRTADWFGLKGLICSSGTADWTNPKVLRSSMGSAFRLPLIYVDDLSAWLSQHPGRVVVADLDGENASNFDWQGNEWIVLGNEANGVSEAVRNLAGVQKVFIGGKGKAESLNVASAGAVLGYLVGSC